ncbi:Serine-pyruvate aminotransferase [Phytophthora palmivora]|uniref:Serine-pyruvate aminotransferase n=1 Tax=Phytophthora palmivora TaxID=4796 RepID=A0A2P4XK40_9STRA|nr:Serine-pyruvate aminotransferase [Phytophthora palmivora]
MTHSSEMLELIPGPSQMLPNVLEALGTACGSSDLDPAFWDDYLALERSLQEFLHAERCSVAIQSGEAMLALWGALKSTLKPGDVVVCAANGLFGEGFADMARALGADVRVVKGDWRKTIDVEALCAEIRRSNPKLVTAVHCETPSGVLNNLEGVGEAVANHTTDGLFLVDFVSSAAGAPLNVDAGKIDLGLHEEVSAFTRHEVQETLGLQLYGEESAASPTVTAVELPDGCDWDALQEELRARKLLVGGSYGPLKGKVLRLGHMGSQASKEVVAQAIQIIGAALEKLK